ncbi:MAG: hypothetical protein GWO24_04735, partial [Akkermansiaceae bacterium]|nr:hypothetical protein [Akkermansiaceae bacterium]
TGLHVAAGGDILVADEFNHRIRSIVDPLSITSSPGSRDPFGRNLFAGIDAASLGLVLETVYHFRWVAADGSTQMFGQSFSL